MNGNNNIYIGNLGAGDESQTIRIGTAQAQTFIAGIVGASVTDPAPVVIDMFTGQLAADIRSSARYKQDITAMGARSDGLLKLRPVTFAYKEDARGVTHYGLVAEEVQAVYPELVTCNSGSRSSDATARVRVLPLHRFGGLIVVANVAHEFAR